MADTVVVQTTASSAGAPVAVEALGGADYQLVKLVAGQSGVSVPIAATTGVPAAGSMGMVVAVKDGVSVSVANIPTVATLLGTVAVNVVAGGAGGGSVTTGQPASNASGQLVWIVGGQDATGVPIRVTGTVAAGAGTTVISGTVSVSGTAVVSVVPGVSVTIQQGVSVSAQVSGTITISPTTFTVNTAATIAGASVVVGNIGFVDVTTDHPAYSSTGIVARAIMYGSIAGSSAYQEILIDSAGRAYVTLPNQATVAISPTVLTVNTVASVTVVTQLGTAVVTLATGGTLATLLGTVAVNVVAGGAGGGSVTTAGPSISATGQVIWIAGGQGTTATPVVVTGTVSAGAGTTVVSIGGIVGVTTQTSVSVTGLPVWFAPGALVTISGTAAISGTVVVNSVPTISTLLGTVAVNVVAGSVAFSTTAVATTTATSGVTGAIVWLGVGQTLATLNVLNTVVTQLGTQVVSVVPGVSVSLGSLATVVGTTTGTSGVTGPIVWLGVNQTMSALNTVVTVLGTQVVTVVPGLSVSAVVSGTVSLAGVVGVTTAASVSVTGIPVWLNPTQTVAVSGAVLAVVTQTTVGVTGALVYVAQSQSIFAADFARTNWMCNVTATVAGASSMMLFTVMTGNTTGAAAGTSLYVVPAGKVLCIQNVYIYAVSSAVLGPAQLVVVVGSAAASVSLTATVGMAVVAPYAIQASTVMYPISFGPGAYVSAGSTMGLAISGTSHSLVGVLLQGHLI